MEFQRKMFRVDAEKNIIDVDGIPVANESNIRIRLKKVDAIRVKIEFDIVKDQIANTSQYLKFVNALMNEKENELKRKELL
ncbi:MAG: hypothetical protein R3230_01965 [Nitrosopumilaceae archaeon]|nr:hypothetical protein [Nitrosopumilaceae archaeon]